MRGTHPWEPAGGGTGVLAPPERPPARRQEEGPRRKRAHPPGLPPGDADDGGSGGGGDGWKDGPTPPDDGPPPGTAELGLALALAGIVTLFVVFLFTWVLLRRNAPEWPPAESPAAPDALWTSTLLLGASSAALAAAGRARRAERRGGVGLGLGASLALGLAFLASQALLWRELAAAGFVPSTNGYGAIFYALTGLHGAHVAAGLCTLAWLFARSCAGLPPERSLRLGATYWHSMGAIWIVLFLALYLVH